MKSFAQWMLRINLLAVMCILAMPNTTLQAQKVVIDNVLKAKSRGSGTIINKNVVAGYYAFYMLDKAEKGKNNFMLVLYDQDLVKVASDKFVADKYTIANESAYNGTNLVIKFSSLKTKAYTYKSYNAKAENIGTATAKMESQMDYGTSDPRTGEQGENKLLIPTDEGFVDYFILQKGIKVKTRYGMRLIGNDGKIAWTYTSPDKPKDFEGSAPLTIGGGVIISQVTKRPNLFSRDAEEYLLGVSLETGKKLFENSVEDPTHAVIGLSADAREDGGTLYGLYFDKDAKTAKDPSKGLFSFQFGYDGKVTARKFISWEKDVAAFLPVSSKGKIKDIGHLYFHKFQRTADGKTFGIAEQFRREASALGIATQVLGQGRSNTSVVKAAIEDIYLFEFDQKFDLAGVTVYDKSKTNVELPSGAEYWTPRTTGYMLDLYGQFDYTFTQASTDNSEFYVGYLDRQKMEKGKRDWIFGAITYRDGGLTTDKTVVGSEATWFTVQPAKPGYFVVTEYFRKKKTLEFRMEKFN